MAGRVEGKVAVLIGGGQTAGETVGNGRATALFLLEKALAFSSLIVTLSQQTKLPK